MKNRYIYALFACLLFTQQSLASESIGNWYGEFTLKQGIIVKHFSSFVEVDGNKSTDNLIIQREFYKGIPLNPCGIDICVDSTKEDFVNALLASGAYDPDHQAVPNEDVITEADVKEVEKDIASCWSFLCYIINCCTEDDGADQALLVR